jgi:hypothetical protein
MNLDPPTPPPTSGPTDPDALKRRVQRHSPHRLLRKKLVLPGGITISAELRRGRILVRIEAPADDTIDASQRWRKRANASDSPSVGG